MPVTNFPAGGLGSAVSPEVWAAYVLDHLSAASVVLASGATEIRTTNKQLHVPRVLTNGTAVWLDELEPIPEGAPTGDVLVLTPKKVATLANFSDEVVSDSSPSVLDTAGTAMTRAVALEADRAYFGGTGVWRTGPPGSDMDRLPRSRHRPCRRRSTETHQVAALVAVRSGSPPFPPCGGRPVPSVPSVPPATARRGTVPIGRLSGVLHIAARPSRRDGLALSAGSGTRGDGRDAAYDPSRPAAEQGRSTRYARPPRQQRGLRPQPLRA